MFETGWLRPVLCRASARNILGLESHAGRRVFLVVHSLSERLCTCCAPRWEGLGKAQQSRARVPGWAGEGPGSGAPLSTCRSQPRALRLKGEGARHHGRRPSQDTLPEPPHPG